MSELPPGTNICVDVYENSHTAQSYPEAVDMPLPEEEDRVQWLVDHNLWKFNDWVRTAVISFDDGRPPVVRYRFRTAGQAVMFKLAHS